MKPKAKNSAKPHDRVREIIDAIYNLGLAVGEKRYPMSVGTYRLHRTRHTRRAAMREIKIGQIWKAKRWVDIYKLLESDYFIILSRDGIYWQVGMFLFSGSKKYKNDWGGAR